MTGSLEQRRGRPDYHRGSERSSTTSWTTFTTETLNWSPSPGILKSHGRDYGSLHYCGSVRARQAMTGWTLVSIRDRILPHNRARRAASLQPPWILTMATKSQRPKGREGALSLLNAAIEAINFAKEASSITPAHAAFGAAGVLLTMIRVRSLLFCNEMPQVHS